MLSSLPTPLAGLAEAISGAATRQPAVEFVAGTWRRWLTASSSHGGAGMADGDVDRLFQRFPGERVSRRDVQEVALGGSSAQDNRLLFITAMVWGRGKSNARMLPGVMRALDSTKCDETLAVTARCIADGNIEAAYRLWRLPGIREPFFTKWFWAAGYRSGGPLRPLVLDGRVWSTLSALGWNSIDAAASTRRAKRYTAYVEAAHVWADHLSNGRSVVTAEDVEFTLFAAAGNLERLGRPAVPQ